MAFTSLSQSEVFTNLVTTTLKDIDPLLVPQIYAAVTLMEHLRKNGRTKMINGGLQIAVGVVGEKNPNFEWYNGSTVAADGEAEQFTRALYDWALARVAVKISDEDVDINSGDKHKLHDLLLELIENAKATFIDEINTALNGTRTATNQLLGLGDIITEATPVTVGGLSPTTNTYWDNQRIVSGVTFFTSAALPGNLKFKLQELYNDCIAFVPSTKRSGIFMVTDMDIFAGYENTLENIAQYQLSDARKENFGFGLADDVLTYKNKPIFWDNAAPAGELRLVNSEYLRLAVHSKRNFSWDPARVYPNAHATISYGRFMGQLVTNFRRAHGLLANVVADA